MNKNLKTPDHGFFPASMVVGKQPKGDTAKCGKCALFKKCKQPFLKTVGKGAKKILVILSHPIKETERTGKWQHNELDRQLDQVGIDMYEDCWVTGALICHDENRGSAASDKVLYDRIDCCNPNLRETVNRLNPEIIVIVGKDAIRSMLSDAWKEGVGETKRWIGYTVPHQKSNTWICPINDPDDLDMSDPIASLFARKHMKAISKLSGRPWYIVPDYESQIECIYDDAKAASVIREYIEDGRECAFDYEANMLLPETTGAKLICASICDGNRTIAFPWHGKVIPAMIEFLRSPVPKIASNLKYEERVSRRLLNTSVRNWHWDTMLGAHLIDGRKDITSIKFQAFILLGFHSYDSQMKPFFKSKPNTLNKIHQIAMGDLLHYCGLDSLLEYEVAQIQKEEIDGY